MRAARPHRLAVFVVGTVLAIGAPRAGADPVRTTVVAGDRVRYRTSDHGGWTEAKVLDVRRDSWLVRREYQDPSWVSTSTLRRAEVFRETGPLVMEGFLFGLVPGAILGAYVSAFACLDYEGPGDCPGVNGRLMGALVVGGTFGGIGAAIAKLVKPEQWDPIVVERVQVTVAPMLGPRGRGLGASVSIRF
jgi:hypothetical protein